VSTVLVTGCGGLVGSAAAAFYAGEGWDVVGIENDMRARFFGPSASVAPVVASLRGVDVRDLDIRDAERLDRLVADRPPELLVHAAAQPSHDWAASDPATDFDVNATATLNLLEAVRRHAPDCVVVFMSTNKVYGDAPNRLPLEARGRRLELPDDHPWHGGIDTRMSIDRTLHSLFGVSKAAADLLVQEYGRYFGLRTVCFRAGCITGPNHAGARLHGFLSYLVRCAVTGEHYTVYGYGGLQVRDNIHADDLVQAFEAFRREPRSGAVYNIGGGRAANCSVLEAIALAEQIAGRPLSWSLSEEARVGDHRWWISDNEEFRRDYPEWRITRGIEATMREIAERWRPD
jgi:CDP-paratose 2-epimerase